jgi:hypothetical protein
MALAGRRRRKRQGRGEKETMMAVARGRAPVPPCRPRACSVPPPCRRPVHAPRRFFPLSAAASSHGSALTSRPVERWFGRPAWPPAAVVGASISCRVPTTRARSRSSVAQSSGSTRIPQVAAYRNPTRPGEVATDGWNALTVPRPVENRSKLRRVPMQGTERGQQRRSDRNKSVVGAV